MVEHVIHFHHSDNRWQIRQWDYLEIFFSFNVVEPHQGRALILGECKPQIHDPTHQNHVSSRDLVVQENSLTVFIYYSSYLMLTKWCLNIEARENNYPNFFGCFCSLSRGDVQVRIAREAAKNPWYLCPTFYHLQCISTNINWQWVILSDFFAIRIKYGYL